MFAGEIRRRRVARLKDAFHSARSLPHGHVAAVLGTLKKLRLDRTIASAASPERQRIIALIAARILDPGSKLATARSLAQATARDSLAKTLDIEDTDEDDLYAAMDWLLERQDAIERRLAKRGHSRDGKRGKLQIEFGLRVGKSIGKYKMAKHFELDIADLWGANCYSRRRS